MPNFDLNNVDDQQAFYSLFLLALCIWREARGEPVETKIGVAWTIRNRVVNPSWWGDSWISVILKPWQFSSFNAKDPNAIKWPYPNDTSWQACLQIARNVFTGGMADSTSGATSYFDRSLDSNPPSWATDGSMVHACDIGSIHFYRRV